jgi:hypothetical protein
MTSLRKVITMIHSGNKVGTNSLGIARLPSVLPLVLSLRNFEIFSSKLDKCCLSFKFFSVLQIVTQLTTASESSLKMQENISIGKDRCQH